MFCIRCGQEMPDSLNFCTNCGNDLSTSKVATGAGTGAAATRQMPQPVRPTQPAPSGNRTTQAIPQPATYQQVRPVDPGMAAGRTSTPQAGTQEGSTTVPLIIAIAVVAALVLSAIAYFAVGGSKDDTSAGSSATSSPTASQSATDNGSHSQATKQPSGDEDDPNASDDTPVASGAPRFSTLSTSSVLTGDIDSHQPDCLVDGNTTTAWCEGVSGTGEGEWIEFRSDMKQNVRSIRIMAGFNKSEDLYWKNSRPKDITITFDDGTTTTSTLSDEPFAWHTITLSETVQTTSVRITIDSTYPGSRYTDTCISEITIQ